MNLQQLEAKLTAHPESPLFIRVAQEYLVAGNIEKAKELCHSGLERYPSYVSALLVLAKCYAAEKQFDAAIRLLKQVLAVYPNSEVLQSLLEGWLKQSAKQPEQQESASQEMQEIVSDKNIIVSKTLAEIYALQGQFEEAIRTYKLLQEQQPERRDEFEMRIRELRDEASGSK